MTPNQRHLANCFEISATRFPGGGDTNGRDAGGDLASRYIKCLFVSMGRYSMYSMRLPFPTPLKCHKVGFGGRTTIPNYVYCNYAIKSYFCCHWRNITSNCATGSSNVTKILRLVRDRKSTRL